MRRFMVYVQYPVNDCRPFYLYADEMLVNGLSGVVEFHNNSAEGKPIVIAAFARWITAIEVDKEKNK